MSPRGLYYSGGLHLALLFFALFGLPDLFSDPPEPEPIVVTLEPLPISRISNVKPTPPKPPAPPEKKPPKPAPSPKPTPPVKKEEPTPKPEPKENPVKVEDKEAPPEKKEEKPKETPQEKDELDAILQDIKEKARQEMEQEKQPEAPVDAAPEHAAISDKHDPTLPLSISDRDAIISQIAQNWRVPAGAKGDYTLNVTVKVQVQTDGTVLRAELAAGDRMRAAGDPFFRAAADSAVRAVWKSSPLKNLPTDRYDAWKDMELTFNPKYLLY
jgi:outer membrane biosynthesis protein TonB